MCLKYIDLYSYMYMVIYFHIHACSCIYIYKSDELARQVKYNPAEVTFKGLLDVFFGRVDVTALNRQVLNPIYIKNTHIFLIYMYILIYIDT